MIDGLLTLGTASSMVTLMDPSGAGVKNLIAPVVVIEISDNQGYADFAF